MRSAFKMKGMDFGNDKTNVKRSKHELEKGTEIIGGSVREEKNDLEMRIEDLRSDLKGGGEGKVNVMAVGKQIMKLEAQLKKLKAE